MSGRRHPEISINSIRRPVEGWQCAAASVRGAAHIRSGAVNQDAVRSWQATPKGLPLVLAVADGHGGAAYTRSHIGAAYAVNTAVRVLARDLLPRLITPDIPPDLTLVKRLCDEWLPKVLVRRWQERVRRYTRRYPFASHELGSLPAESDNTADLLTPYGATLVAGLLTEQFHLYLQLGDGDILTVAADGTVSRPALPADARLLGNETTSLCMANAAASVRLAFQPTLGEPPGLVLLSTDGYANSFVDPSSFEQVGADLLAAIRADGLAGVGEQLPDWLAQTSAAGSGDDISLVLALHSA
ncbi:MAG: protein phosphatase 2C domain-containing protein [Caldilineaceae bacterium]|nr:protein phosphatase 2C domain-containing protein [Caldilineaceae bacterium]HRJ44848.1 PP2C family serine/threonine-protein phosphatase [Caldilineaceae bacterium]